MRASCKAILFACTAFLLACAIVLGVRASYPRPYSDVVHASGAPASLVYAVMKAESRFDPDAVSHAGAVGIMQIKPSTAEFICRKDNIAWEADRLSDGAYNTALGCHYLSYLLTRFSDERTAVCAYNAGEGTVRRWLSDAQYSKDGVTLSEIPYAETRAYAKKVAKFRKIYEFLYE